jgi:hypothetical protein
MLDSVVFMDFTLCRYIRCSFIHSEVLPTATVQEKNSLTGKPVTDLLVVKVI